MGFMLGACEEVVDLDVLAGLWAPRANRPLNPAFWRPTWPQDWPKLGQEGEHFEAKKWQI